MEEEQDPSPRNMTMEHVSLGRGVQSRGGWGGSPIYQGPSTC